MQYQLVGGLYWHDQWKQAGTVIAVNPDDPADAALLEYYAPFGAMTPVREEAGSDTVPPSGGDAGGEPASAPEHEAGTPPMTSGDQPTHVGRRRRE